VVVVEPTGAETELVVEVGGQRLVIVMHGRTDAQPDETIHVGVEPARAHLFDGATGKRIG
jgi:multiple sugar transport system ATP-binding protein